MFERAIQIADAVLYEGYLLYPYRASARKNQLRWQFGVLAPRTWSDAGGSEAWWMQTECLFVPRGEFCLTGRLRFLQLERRDVERMERDSRFTPVESFEHDGQRYISWDEAVLREVDFDAASESQGTIGFECPGGETVEVLHGSDGQVIGRFVRRRWPISGTMTVTSEPIPGRDLVRLRVRVENLAEGTSPGAPRETAMRQACLSAHTLLSIAGGEFLSLMDPPEHVRDLTAACENVRSYPVLAGDLGDRSLILSAPIILSDHPAIAPESQGSMFDGTEIDELLALSTLSLTDDEKEEVRATDERARAVLDRVESMTAENWAQLHGAVRESPADVPVDVLCGSVRVGQGARVRLTPGNRNTDAQDMFLVGRIGRVAKILRDFEGKDYLAVTLEDDPAADVYALQGRHHYFYPDEVEPVGASG